MDAAIRDFSASHESRIQSAALDFKLGGSPSLCASAKTWNVPKSTLSARMSWMEISRQAEEKTLERNDRKEAKAVFPKSRNFKSLALCIYYSPNALKSRIVASTVEKTRG